MNLQLEVGYRRHSVKIVDVIKYHVFRIQALLNQLTALAKDDKELNEEIAKFHVEISVNMDHMIKGSLVKLDIIQKKRLQAKPGVHVSAPIESSRIKKMVDA